MSVSSLKSHRLRSGYAGIALLSDVVPERLLPSSDRSELLGIGKAGDWVPILAQEITRLDYPARVCFA